MTNNQLSTQIKRDITTDPSLLTGADIKKYFDPQNLLTEKQVGQALALCKGRNLNPFANEVYIVAYQNNSGTEFSLIVSKEAFMKRAERCEGYDGFDNMLTLIFVRNSFLSSFRFLQIPILTFYTSVFVLQF